jgi:hypothetical protein
MDRRHFVGGPAVTLAIGVIAAEFFDLATVSAPAARDVVDRLVEHLDLFDLQLTADGVVIERSGGAGGGDVEAGQIATQGAAVAGDGHGPTVLVVGQLGAPGTLKVG